MNRKSLTRETEKTKTESPEQIIERLERELRQKGQELDSLQLEMGKVKEIAKSIVSQLLSPCPSCGMKMLTLDWNSAVWLLTCANSECKRHGHPIKTMSKAELNMLDLYDKKERKKDVKKERKRDDKKTQS